MRRTISDLGRHARAAWTAMKPVAPAPDSSSSGTDLKACAERQDANASPETDVRTADAALAQDYAAVVEKHGERFLCPSDLTISMERTRVLLVGQCFFSLWKTVEIDKNLSTDSQFFNFANMDEMPDNIVTSASHFDFQVVNVPLCVAIPDDYLKTAAHDQDGFRRHFEGRQHLVQVYLDLMMKFNKRYGLESYVCNFTAPQAGFQGRFASRYDLSNILFFTEEMNRHLAELIKGYSNTYLVDADAVCAAYGKRLSRDDFYWQSNHGGTVTDAEEILDRSRLRVTPSAKALYRADAEPFVHALWQEIIAMHRTLHAADSVKMVVIDLDDTLWRGLVGEGEAEVGGWQGGVCEALHHLKNRGILLAIISKNDETVVRNNWQRIVGSRLSIDDFAIVRINYAPKVANMDQILQAVNLLPRNVVFIDDNPVERDAMTSAYPDIRVLGDIPAYLKRILMWSSETQVAGVSQESARRTTMIRAQIEREEARQTFSREDFLAGLSLAMTIETIRSVEDRNFPRAVELVNKTNQFNTSGLRMTQPQAADHFRRGGLFFVFTVADKHTSYGLVGVLICTGGDIDQFVMSCRVAGLDVEEAVMAALLPRLAQTGTVSRAPLVRTDVNLLCLDVFANAGFTPEDANGNRWIKDLSAGLPAAPAHIDVTTRFDP